jgi:hypothetical protein
VNPGVEILGGEVLLFDEGRISGPIGRGQAGVTGIVVVFPDLDIALKRNPEIAGGIIVDAQFPEGAASLETGQAGKQLFLH